MNGNEVNLRKDERRAREEGAPRKKKAGVKSFIWEVVQFMVLALIIVFPIRVFIAQPYIVSGSSMVPTFENGNYLIVDQLSYRFEEPRRGDVVVFRFPRQTSKFFIKRIIGIPGETVKIENGAITIAEKSGESEILLSEPYIKRRAYDTMEVALGESEYFVMGDNRSASLDSRIWGPLDEKFIIGRALLRLLPVTEAAVLPGKYEY